MMLRRPVILTTMQEDFRKIGLLSEDEGLDEVDNPENPRDVQSPDPSTMSGLDNSAGGGNAKAKQSGANQPKPAMAPSDKNDHEDPLQAGGAQRGKNRGAGHKAGDMREMDQYKDQGGQVLPKAADQGKNADKALGLKPVKKHAGMTAGTNKSYGESAFDRAFGLLDEVGNILRGISTDEDFNHILRGVRLVSENSALLADRMTEISEVFSVDEAVSTLENLSEDAAELYGLIEMNLDGHSGEEEEERAAVRNSKVAAESRSDRDPTKTYDVPSPAFKEQVEEMLGAMVSEFMEHLKAYDGALSEMSKAMDGDDADDGEDDKKKSKSDDDDDDDGDDDDKGKGKGRMGEKFAAMRTKFRGKSEGGY
jgi:hypothetical protein